MVIRQVLYEWTDAENPQQIMHTAGSDVEHDDSDSLDSVSISKDTTAPSPVPSIECGAIQNEDSEGKKATDCDKNEDVINLINEEPNPESPSKSHAPYTIPIWRFPDDTIVPPQLYMTQRPQASERSATVNEQTEDDRFPRYVMVFRRGLKSTASDTQDELLGEVKVEKRTSLAELRRIITEVNPNAPWLRTIAVEPGLTDVACRIFGNVLSSGQF